MFVYHLPPAYRFSFLGDLRHAQADVRDGNVSNKLTVIEYENWNSLCANLGFNHFLDETDYPLVYTIQVYGHRFLHGHYYNKISVRVDMVSSACALLPWPIFWKAVPTPPKPRGYISWYLHLRFSC